MKNLTKTEQHWDNATLNYNLEKYNFPEWALSLIQEVAPHVSALETLHKDLTPEQLLKVQRHVQDGCSRKNFMEMFDAFVEEYVPPRIDNKKYMIQRQGTLRCVIPNQSSSGRRLHFHQGIWVGNGRGLRTIWTPFTKTYGSNSMQIMDITSSRKLTQKVYVEKMLLEEFEDLAIKQSFPVDLVPGQSHLFFQEHIHGNINNDTDITRVSLDMRILIEGEEYHRKLPGGYFRLPGDHAASVTYDCTGKHFITYAGWNTKFSKGIPLTMQRAIIDPYCNKNSISYSDYQFENEYLDWCPGLRSFIQNKPDGIVLCSIFSLPDDPEYRNDIIYLALENNVELHFANEMLVIKNKSDVNSINEYLNFAVHKDHNR